MDLQAILDASSSSEDDDGGNNDVNYTNYKSKYNSINNSNTNINNAINRNSTSNSNAINASISNISNLSNASSSSSSLHNNEKQQHHHPTNYTNYTNAANAAAAIMQEHDHDDGVSEVSDGIEYHNNNHNHDHHDDDDEDDDHDGISAISNNDSNFLNHGNNSNNNNNDNNMNGLNNIHDHDNNNMMMMMMNDITSKEFLRAAELNFSMDITAHLNELREECGLVPRIATATSAGIASGNGGSFGGVGSYATKEEEEEEEEEEDIVGQILRSYQQSGIGGGVGSGSSIGGGGGSSNRANLELERILREADANDDDNDDDDDDENDDDENEYFNNKHSYHVGTNNNNNNSTNNNNMSPSRRRNYGSANNSRSSSFNNTPPRMSKISTASLSQSSTLSNIILPHHDPYRPHHQQQQQHSNNEEFDILQSILNENDEDDDDDDNYEYEEKVGNNSNSNSNSDNDEEYEKYHNNAFNTVNNNYSKPTTAMSSSTGGSINNPYYVGTSSSFCNNNGTLQQQQQQQHHQHPSHTELSDLSNVSGGCGGGIMRGLTNYSTTGNGGGGGGPISHSMEVDAILNSVQDDDDDDDDEDSIMNGETRYGARRKYYNRGISTSNHDTDTDDTEGNDDDDDDGDGADIGLNLNFSTGLVGGGSRRDVISHLSRHHTIEMQYPLVPRREGTSSNGQEDARKKQGHYGKEILVHGDDGTQRTTTSSFPEEKYSLKEYTANFLHSHGKNKNITTGSDGRDDASTVSMDGKKTLSFYSRDASSSSGNHPLTDDEQMSRQSSLCLRQAEAYERRLLKPNTRNIISPLSVKRRMKPKVELMTKSRMNQSSQQSSSSATTTAAVSSSLSSSSQVTHQTQSHSNQSQSQPRFSFSGGIIQLKSMSTLGSQLLQHSDNNSSNTDGAPTALAVNSKFIAVGMQSGIVMVFDLFEQLKMTLGRNMAGGEGNNPSASLGTSTAPLSTGGPVTSIDLSLHGDYLLAGYGSGTIVLWDVIKGSILKSMNDVHSSPITSIRLTSFPMAGKAGGVGGGGGGDKNDIGAVSVDASGLVNKLVFSKGMLWSTYSVETECLLDGTAGQILAMDALPPLDSAHGSDGGREGGNGTFEGEGAQSNIILIALSSDRSSFAVSVEPKVSVLHRWARPAAERIDPTIVDQYEQSTQASSNYASTYASSYASSYLSTSTYASSSVVTGPKESSESQSQIPPFLPCLSWGWALVSGGGNLVTPILARSWGCCLQFLRANFPESDGGNDDGVVHWPAFGLHDEFVASSPVVALNWLGKRSLMYLTVTNEFTIIDTVIMTMQERLDFSGMNLIYAEFTLSRPPASARGPGSNVCTTFMNSIRSNDNRLLVLCQGQVKQITVLGMTQQIMSLEDGGQWLEALALALDHYESTVVSQEDRMRDSVPSKHSYSMTTSDRSLLTEDEIWMAELLMRYLRLAIENAPDSSPTQFSHSTSKQHNRIDFAQSHFEMLSGVCIEYTIVTRRLDLLFGPIFQCFYEARYINVFLDVLQSYILNDKLNYIAPEAMALFIAHCKDIKDLSTVERCLLHMDCSLMDFDSILSLLKKNMLYTGMFHVYSSGLDDYVSPLELLFEGIFDEAETTIDSFGAARRKDSVPSSKFEQYGYKALLYLKYCFTGKSFPKGNAILPEERVQTIRPELFALLLREMCDPPRPRQYGSQSQQTSFRGIRTSAYPYLLALILVDTKAFLDCLAIVLDDPVARFAEATSLTHTTGSWALEYGTDDTTQYNAEMDAMISQENENDPELLPDRQHLVNILSSIIMSNKLADSSQDFISREQIQLLSTNANHAYVDFLAKYLQLGVITTPKHLTGEVFVRLCSKEGSSEEEILTLLHAIPQTSYDLDDVLHTVENAQLPRGALFLHKVGLAKNMDRAGMLDKCRHHFNSSINCYLSDDDRDFKMGVFSYARKECYGGNESMLPEDGMRDCASSCSSLLRNVLIQRLPELIKLDSVNTAHLVAEIFAEDIDMILSTIKGIDSGRAEYNFLNAVISGDLAKIDVVSAQELAANLTINHHHKYLSLMVKFEPDVVYQYLSSNRNYQLDDALKLCKERRITDASAYLLERMGDVSGALQLMLLALDTRMITLKKILQENGPNGLPYRSKGVTKPKSGSYRNESAEKEIVGVKQILVAVLDLCERNKNDHLILENERGPLLWFHVLDRLVHSKSLLRVSKESTEHHSITISSVLSELLLLTMQRMISNVSLFDLMHKITRDYAGSDLGEFREMLVSMLKTYSSELDICSNAVDVMLYDIRKMSVEKKKLKVRGSFVKSCSKHIPKTSIVEINPSGNCKATIQRRINDNMPDYNQNSNPAMNAVSILRIRRHNERQQSKRKGRATGIRGGRGDTKLNLMTASESQFLNHGGGALSNQHDFFGARQVGLLSDAQHVGGLF